MWQSKLPRHLCIRAHSSTPILDMGSRCGVKIWPIPKLESNNTLPSEMKKRYVTFSLFISKFFALTKIFIMLKVALFQTK